jgi:soluble lytic murein transglycosylase-like protein
MKRKEDFRIICDCQRHRRSNRGLLGRALSVAWRGAAVLVSIPVAFAAFDIPTSAMNLYVGKRAPEVVRVSKAPAAVTQQSALPIFTSRSVRDQFLAVEPRERSLTIDMFKEAYFRKHVPYGAIIFREARKNGLPPELVAAMVHTESDFRPGLVSHKSAQGLMQIVPSTARLLGIRDPFNPEENIAAGTKYFRYLLNRFDDETMALAAYNAGEGNVQRFGGVPPFAETREYITKVNRRQRRYRERVHNTYLAALRVQRPVAQ